jgi:hypothetical protein
MKKIKVKEEDSYGLYELSGDLTEIISWLEELKSQGWETMEIDSGIEEVIFSMSRLETDEEFEKRKKEIQRHKELKKKLKTAKEEKELDLYQKLKQKYEPKIMDYVL